MILWCLRQGLRCLRCEPLSMISIIQLWRRTPKEPVPGVTRDRSSLTRDLDAGRRFGSQRGPHGNGQARTKAKAMQCPSCNFLAVISPPCCAKTEGFRGRGRPLGCFFPVLSAESAGPRLAIERRRPQSIGCPVSLRRTTWRRWGSVFALRTCRSAGSSRLLGGRSPRPTSPTLSTAQAWSRCCLQT